MNRWTDRSLFACLWIVTTLCICCGSLASAGETELNGFRFTLPEGFEIEQVAGPGLVNRPISADFDERGRLYIGDSSGSNEDVKIQLRKKPHRIVRLEDTDGDGRFDKSVVFADKMMFPEGTLWHEGSLYVGAPPHIWKLTDTTGDGQADTREVWFDGKTLTHCGNDMHGPYLGPDGWFHWCKGAFAEQEYHGHDGQSWRTKAAHIFRRHPSGGPIEAVMTGGMDNPVEVVFTPGGERIFSTTFLVHPAAGQRDGIIHAIYGGVYGKAHGVLDGHPRTGPLMPALTHHGGASAPCGLARLETNHLGADFQDNVLACSFNMHKIIRHVLQPDGGSFQTKDTDFLVCDSLNFHPTDVIEDADGSLLVIDTGGWYKMCCPTSQLGKPDILGGVYRVRRTGSHKVVDPRGTKILWPSISDRELVALLADKRWAIRNRARKLLGSRGVTPISELQEILTTSDDRDQRLQAVWALTQNDHSEARPAVRVALGDEDETVRQAALHSVSIRRDARANKKLRYLLTSDSLANRRAAAEALGRLGDPNVIADLLAASDDVTDRAVEHSLIFAVIETGTATPVRALLQDPRPRVRSAALIALDQMPSGGIRFADVQTLLGSPNAVLNETAWWVANQHPEWAGDLADYFQEQLVRDDTDRARLDRLSQRLARFAHSRSIQQLMGQQLDRNGTAEPTRVAIVAAIQNSGLRTVPESWIGPLRRRLQSPDAEIVAGTVVAIRELSGAKPVPEFVELLTQISARDQLPDEIRMQALVAIPRSSRKADTDGVEFLCDRLSVDQPVSIRALAVDILVSTPLSSEHLQSVAQATSATGPMELRRLMEMFARSKDSQVGFRLVDALGKSPVASSLTIERLRQQLAGFGDTVRRRAKPLFAEIERDNREKILQLESIVKLVDGGDIRRGQQVFHNSKAACLSCHGMGYLGGRLGPDLTRIGNIRTERDLLESILFPNLSFVRSYEPTTIVTGDGKVYNGLVRNETDTELVLQIDVEKVVRIAPDAIDVRQPGKISVMPAGLDKHFTPQQLADLIVFLKAAK